MLRIFKCVVISPKKAQSLKQSIIVNSKTNLSLDLICFKIYIF